MDETDEATRVVSVSQEIAAGSAQIFELIADPAEQPSWDGNDNLASAQTGQRVRAVGDVFTMTTTKGHVRENHVVEFAEGRLIAWLPAEVGKQPPGHLWRWELEPMNASRTRVTTSPTVAASLRAGTTRLTRVSPLAASMDPAHGWKAP